METMSDVTSLAGTLDVLVAQDGEHVAHITSVATEQFKGSFVTLRHGASCSRLGLGLSLISVGLSVLHVDGHILGDEVKDLLEEIEELVRGNEPKPSDTPF